MNGSEWEKWFNNGCTVSLADSSGQMAGSGGMFLQITGICPLLKD